MKVKKIELEIDFIGGQGTLTIEEEKALSVFFQQRKLKKNKKTSKEKILPELLPKIKV